MTKIISSPHIRQFLDRFYGFSDSVLRSILISFHEGGTRSMEISIATRDAETIENDGWVCVVLSVGGVSEISLCEHTTRTSIQVISHGIHISKYEKKFGIEFGGAIDAPETIADLRGSDVYVLGGTLSFDVLPY